MTSAGQTMLLNVRFLQNLSFGLTCISSSESDSSTSNLESTSRSASGTSRSNREKKKGSVYVSQKMATRWQSVSNALFCLLF